MTVAVVFSFSRGALLGLAAAGVYAVIVHWRRLPVILGVLGVGIALVVGVYKRDPGRFDTSFEVKGNSRAGEHRIAPGHVGGRARADRRTAAARRRPGELQGLLLAGHRPAGRHGAAHPGPQLLPRRRHGDRARRRRGLPPLPGHGLQPGEDGGGEKPRRAGPRVRADGGARRSDRHRLLHLRAVRGAVLGARGAGGRGLPRPGRSPGPTCRTANAAHEGRLRVEHRPLRPALAPPRRSRRLWREEGGEVKVLCLDEAVADSFRALGVDAAVTPLTSKLDLRGAAAVWRHLAGADVVHTQDPRTGLLVRPQAYARGLKVVHTFHGLPYHLAMDVRPAGVPAPVAANGSSGHSSGHMPAEALLSRLGRGRCPLASAPRLHRPARRPRRADPRHPARHRGAAHAAGAAGRPSRPRHRGGARLPQGHRRPARSLRAARSFPTGSRSTGTARCAGSSRLRRRVSAWRPASTASSKTCASTCSRWTSSFCRRGGTTSRSRSSRRWRMPCPSSRRGSVACRSRSTTA